MINDPISDTIREATEAKRTEEARRRWSVEQSAGAANRCVAALKRALDDTSFRYFSRKDVVRPRDQHDSEIQVNVSGDEIEVEFSGSVVCPESDYPAQTPRLRCEITYLLKHIPSGILRPGRVPGMFDALGGYVVDSQALLRDLKAMIAEAVMNS